MDMDVETMLEMIVERHLEGDTIQTRADICRAMGSAIVFIVDLMIPTDGAIVTQHRRTERTNEREIEREECEPDVGIRLC